MQKTPRLQFTDAEKETPALQKPIRKVQKMAAKADKAQEKIPKKMIRRRQYELDPATGQLKKTLRFEEVDKMRPSSKLNHAVRSAPGDTILAGVHKEIQKSEEDNVGVESAHKLEETAETGGRIVQSAHRSRKLQPYRKAEAAERRLEKANASYQQKRAAYEVSQKAQDHANDAAGATGRGGQTAHSSRQLQFRHQTEAAGRGAETVNAGLSHKRMATDAPQLSSNPISRWQQKQAIKKEYAAAKRAGKSVSSSAAHARHTAQNTATAAKKAAEKTKQAGQFVWRHKKGFLIVLGLGLILLFFLNGLSSCSVMVEGVVGSIGISSYQSEDADLLGAESAYCALEDELQHYLDTYESTHDYDEYHFDLDEIEHDPYVLLSILSALHEGPWTVGEVQGTLQMLFEKQYILTEDVVVETRYRTETDTWTDEDGNTHTDTYQVPYDYYICTVTLENFNLSHVPVYIMGEDQLSMYAVYMSTLGNRPELFPGSEYVGKYITDPPEEYEIPPALMEDETFAAIITEAEKYVGYPYVWGGSSPSTSFDCSGFVSYVYNQCGWDFGRLGAQGLCNISTRVSSPQPGDLVFFTGTYDTPGVSHVGIYVGNDVMLHCGDPISYANLNSSYWQAHFYCYGRLP